MSRKFKVGDAVLAKPSKSPLYLSAEVTGSSADEYTVRFSTGEVQKISSKYVLTAERRRGRSASKSPSRDMPKSPGRKPKKSGSKSPARTKSPQKTPKKETKKEPAVKEKRERSSSKGRPKKEPAKKETRRSKSNEPAPRKSRSTSGSKKEKKTTKKASPDPDIDLLVQKKVDEKLEMLETTRPEEFSQTESEPEEMELVVTAPPKTKTVVDAKVTTVVERSGVVKRSSARLAAKAGGLDEATAARISLMAEPRPVTTKRDQLYGGNIGVLLLVPLLAGLVFWVNIACQKASCAFLEKPRFPNNWVVTFLSWDYLLAYAGFCLAQMVFSVLPIGKRLKSGESTFRNNVWLAVLLTGAIVGGLTYYKYPVLAKEKDIYTLMAASLIDLLLTSTFVYILGRSATAGTINPKGNAGRFLYDWFVGRELNPMYKWFNIKQLAMRTAYLGWAVIVGSILWRAHAGADKLSWTMAFTGGSQLLYVALQLFREKNLGSTSAGKSEGLGYAFLWTYSCYLPFIPLLIVRYVRAFKIQQSVTFLGVAAAVYALGLVLSLAGKWLKSKYGRRGYGVTQGSLVSRMCGKVKGSWFGFLRNGSHFGELFMVLGMSLPCGFNAVYPWTYMATSAAATVYRMYSETRGR